MTELEDPLDGKLSKIFDNEDFGYKQITVERPLRIRFEATDDGLERFLAAKTMRLLIPADDGLRESLAHAFWTAGTTSTTEKPVAEKAVATALSAILGIDGKVSREMLKALTVRDDAAPIMQGKDGPEPDVEFRDTEDVPLNEDVQRYFDREVAPYVPDAWIDMSRTKIGYEIPFTRYFYEYVPPRPLNEIDAEISELESEIAELLGDHNG